ncbi:hypothetical protein NA78x_003215 [Anatilimnocola sp. NA78]|uniref:hypothetical protein n=1 Tax=Anatilimnocola sp. NA78 TaxID=3415683 RepID=UPI003CE4D70E
MRRGEAKGAPLPEINEPLATAFIEISPDATIDELSALFAKAREEKKHLPTGQIELYELYGVAVRTPFQGKEDLSERIEFFKQWSEAKPDDPTPLIILARLYTSWGWEARGSGWAATVGQEGFRLFHERLKQGGKFGVAAEKLAPQDPELYRSLVDIGRGLATKREHIDRWVEAGRKVDPTYYPLYQSMAEYLLPRWHGEAGEVEKFAEETCAAVGGDDGLEAYARIAMKMNLYDSEMLYTSEFDPAKIDRGAQLMSQRFPLAPALLDFLAVVAWKGERYEDARKLLTLIRKKEEPDYRHWASQSRYQAFVKYCEAMPVADRADLVFYPYLYGPIDFNFFEGNTKLITLPNQKGEPIKFWDLKDLKQPVGMLPPLPDILHRVVTDTEGKILLLEGNTNENSLVIVLHLDNPTEPVIYRDVGQHGGSKLSPDGKTAATCRSSTIHLWDPATGEQLHELSLETGYPMMRFTPDSSRLLVSHKGNQHVFNVADGKELLVIDNSKAEIPSILSLMGYVDGTAVLGSGTLRTPTGFVNVLTKWDPTNNQRTEFLRLAPSATGGQPPSLEEVSKNHFVLSERGPAGMNDTQVLHVHRLSDGKLVRTISGHNNFIKHLRITPDDKQLVTMEVQGPLRFWNIEERPAAAQ